ncbi:MAG: glycosyltransferase family 1 protein [Patescibacteria group bacterium]
MKIAIDVSQIVYQTGVSRYTENLVESLLKVDNKNDYLLFGTSLRQLPRLNKLKKKFAALENVQFKFFPFPIGFFEIIFNKIHLIKLEKVIGNFDILHTSDWIEPAINQNESKKITTIHDVVPYLFPSSLPRRILKNQEVRLKLVKKESDLIIAVSNSTKEDVVKFLEIPNERIRVINNAASPAFKPQLEEKINEVLSKFKIKKPYILSVATQEPRKNIQKLVDAFEKINKAKPELNLVLTGKYGWGPALDVVPNVIQTGFVKEEELISLYAGCAVFVYPSLYEGFGLPVLEAMACGAPVITSNNSSLVEIAKDAAILIDPRSEGQLKKALEIILNLDTEDRQKMVRASLDRARQYSWSKTAKETLKVYEELARIIVR